MITKIIPKYREKPRRRKAHNAKTHEQYVEELKIKNPNVVPVEEYKDANTPTYHKCLIHEYYWKARPANILNGQGCIYCKGDKLHEQEVMTTAQYNTKLIDRGFNITPLEEYIKARIPIWHWYRDCGHLNKTSPDSILHNNGGCRKCADKVNAQKRQKAHDVFYNQLITVNRNVVLLEKYKGANEKIACQCKICGFIWSPTAASLLHGYGCPECATKSKGELKIREFLDQNHIEYIPQYRIPTLRGKRNPLPYDFYLRGYNLFIEYQGEQHVRPVDYFGGVESFEIQQQHDKQKKEYARAHGIKLLEIWYYDYDKIEEILKIELNLVSVETDIGA